MSWGMFISFAKKAIRGTFPFSSVLNIKRVGVLDVHESVTELVSSFLDFNIPSTV